MQLHKSGESDSSVAAENLISLPTVKLAVALGWLSSQLCAVYGMLRAYLSTVHFSTSSTDSQFLHDSRFCTMAHRCWRILTGVALHLQLVPALPVALPPLATWRKSFSEEGLFFKHSQILDQQCNGVNIVHPAAIYSCPRMHTAYIQNVVPAVNS